MSALEEVRLTASEWAAMMREPLKDKAYQATRLGSSAEAFLAWKALGTTAERTLDQYERDIARLCMDHADLGVEDFTIEHIQASLIKVPARSRRRVKAAWNGLFEWARKNPSVRRMDNPCDLLPDLRVEKPAVYDVFSPTERQRLLTATDESLLPVRNRLGFLIFDELGVRKTEALHLRPKNFDMPSRIAIITKAKGDKERLVPFSDELWRALMDFTHTPIPRVRTKDHRDRWWYEERTPTDDDYIFFPSGVRGIPTGDLDGRGKPVYVPELIWTDPTRPMGQTSLHRWWRATVKRSGVSYRKLHMNRHTYATSLADAEVDTLAMADLLGHENVNTTRVYVHQSRERLQRAQLKLTAHRASEQAKQD